MVRKQANAQQTTQPRFSAQAQAPNKVQIFVEYNGLLVLYGTQA